MKKTVHIIFNAHLDPVWLWPWQSTVDAALATCRSVCDRMDRFPDLCFTKGEAWMYREIERLDPELFKRILKNVERGRWEPIGGWWIQPDCNFPNGDGMRKQIELGQAYFKKTFGFIPRIGFNVDSFGHAAGLPRIMRELGQDRYIMMRPQTHEHSYTSRLFRWQGETKGPELLTFRIPTCYNFGNISLANVERALWQIPEGITHTMLFAGCGDHGGGPTDNLINWCIEHKDAFPGITLKFSTVSEYFDIVAKQMSKIPLVTGELQMHAVGCYSVYRPLKVAVHKAEQMLRQAEDAGANLYTDAEKASLRTAWENVAFNHFHDTLGGTCIPSSYPAVEGQVIGAASTADTLMHHALRLRYPKLKPCLQQRLILLNASGTQYTGYVEAEPWLDWRNPKFNLVDENGKIIPWQQMQVEAGFLGPGQPRTLFRIDMKPGELQQLRLVELNEKPLLKGTACVEGTEIRNTKIRCDGMRMTFGAESLTPCLEVTEDGTDTWSHGVDRFPEGPVVAAPQWQGAFSPEVGPLMASLLVQGTLGKGSAHAEWRVYDKEDFCELKLRIHWAEQRKILKMKLNAPVGNFASERVDGTMGGSTPRKNEGCERPVQNWTLLPLRDGRKLGIVMPDIFAMDATETRLRLTLLRSPIMAHHEPHRGHTPREIYSDQGVHEFRFRFFFSKDITAALLEQHAQMMNKPLLTGDLTKGMAKQY